MGVLLYLLLVFFQFSVLYTIFFFFFFLLGEWPELIFSMFLRKKILAIIKSLKVRSFGFIHDMKMALYYDSLARHLQYLFLIMYYLGDKTVFPLS